MQKFVIELNIEWDFIGSVPKPVTFLINRADLDLGRLLNLLGLLMLAVLNTQAR
jgi:hypothetical protein